MAGVCTEYLIYGVSEGGLDDIRKLDSLLNGLGFTQKKADSQVRWSVLNTVLLLRRHEAARAKLAEAMSMGTPALWYNGSTLEKLPFGVTLRKSSPSRM
ncbi:stress regulated protein [Trifolium medium]|uniref:Stress regulated protein n=1 Tax=Trifolium medium TaxID=97028 RepID=A0A392P9W4_9FABA|nr:stress regulated protein [Trifolium medium]